MEDLISEMNGLGLANASRLSLARDPQMRLCSNLIIDPWYFSDLEDTVIDVLIHFKADDGSIRRSFCLCFVM
ncbi:hypothetical protein ACS0TY_035627 [Phlomoides rotata]